MKTIAKVSLVFSPAIFVGFLVAFNSVNIPVWDDWERGVLLEKYYAKSPEFFSYLGSAHIDHRMIVPRVLIVLMNELTGGNLLWEIGLSYSIYTLGAVGLFFVLRKLMGENAWMYGTAFLLMVALFSPVQYQNFLWAIQIAMLLPFACFGLMMWAFHRKWAMWRKFPVVAGLAWVGTHSFGHGIALWPVAVLMPLFLTEFSESKNRLLFSGGMLACAAATIAMYFLWNYENSSVHAYGQMPGETPPGLIRFAQKPDELGRFVLSAMGSPTARIFPDVIQYAPKMGRITLIVLVGVVGYCLFWWVRKRDLRVPREALPWLAMAAFAMTIMVAMSLGRSAHGWEKGVLPRYAGAGVFLSGALVVLCSWILRRWRSTPGDSRLRETRTRCALVIGCLWLGLQTPTWSHSLLKMEQWKLARFQQRAALLYINHFEPTRHKRIDFSMEFAREQANFLNSKGLLNPPLFEKADFGVFETGDAELEWHRADLVGAGMTEQGLFVHGFATLRGPDRVADGVLIGLRESGSSRDWEIVEMVEMESPIFDPDTAIDGVFAGSESLYNRESHARWRDMVPIDRLPPNADLEVAFWAMDAQKIRLQRLKTTLEFNLSDTPSGTILFDLSREKEGRKLLNSEEKSSKPGMRNGQRETAKP